jgi:hypothetical protein
MKTLRDLVDFDNVEEVRETTVSNSILAEAIEESFTEKRNLRRDNAKKSLKNLFAFMEGQKNVLVESVHAARKQEKNCMKKLREFSRLSDFFMETSNPLPLLRHLGMNSSIRDFCNGVGISVPDQNSDAWEVPSNWSPKKNSE